LYDHRMHGESDAAPATAGIKEKMDLIKVTEWLQERTQLADQQIAWVGESWGAATVLQAGALDKDVAFILADSPFQDWDSAIFERAIRDYGGWVSNIAPIVMTIVDWRADIDHNQASPKEAVKAIKEPVFLIHSQSDPETASTQSVNIAENLNPENSRFHHTNWGSKHCMDLINRP
ncbi:MAG: alpha/beta fold hydrolase, partial [Bacteroidota bacterium]